MAPLPLTLLVGDEPALRGLRAKDDGEAVRYGMGRPIPESDQLWSRLIGLKHVRDNDPET